MLKKLKWKNFIEKTKTRKPTGLLIESVNILESYNQKKGLALDLGCGAGVGVKYLAKKGFKVKAVDSCKDCIEQTKKSCKNLEVSTIYKNIEDYDIKPNTYQLIVAWNSLQFLNKEDSKQKLIDIQRGLKRNGIFVFSLLGIEDDWAKNHSEMSFYNLEEFKKILNKTKILKLTEEKQTKAGATGPVKFWHLIRGIVMREK
ncbi:class I SAM-dependent methyltransferase [Patescibacteria group bacterium]